MPDQSSLIISLILFLIKFYFRCIIRNHFHSPTLRPTLVHKCLGISLHQSTCVLAFADTLNSVTYSTVSFHYVYTLLIEYIYIYIYIYIENCHIGGSTQHCIIVGSLYICIYLYICSWVYSYIYNLSGHCSNAYGVVIHITLFCWE
jgi:hypothetical protein